MTQKIEAERLLPEITGYGSPEADLTTADLHSIIAEALAIIPENSKILAIIPDKTRDDNTHILLPFAAEILAVRKIAKFDALVAQGTHIPMTEAEKLAKIGVKNLSEIPLLENIFDHEWDNYEALVTIGELSAEKVKEITGGLLDKSVPLTINRLLTAGNYDFVLIFGGVVPHEVCRFCGQREIFFSWRGGRGTDARDALARRIGDA